MALEGSLRDFGLADILQLIFFQRKTGILNLEGRMDKVRLLFIDGNIAGAESKRRMEANRLGKVLVKKGLLEEVTLQAILDEQRTSQVKLGNILVRRGIVNRGDIAQIIEGQIKETVIQLFGWKDGTYEFFPQAIPIDKDIPISIDTQHLLMEGLRIVDEWSLIEGKITLDTVFTKTPDADQSGLSREENDIFSLVDGENDVSTIIDIAGMDDYSVSQILVSLLEKEAIELKEAAPVVIEAPMVKTVTPEGPFVLLRLVPVLAIAIAFAVSLIPLFSTSTEIFRKFDAAKEINRLSFMLEIYRAEQGSYPPSLDRISTRPDPWGNPFIYTQGDSSFMLRSTGPDGEKDTMDDLY